MGRPYRKARKSTRGAHHGGLWQTFNEGAQMRKGGVVRSGPSAAPPALFTRGMSAGGVHIPPGMLNAKFYGGMRRGGVYPVMVGMFKGGKGDWPTHAACRSGPFGNSGN